MIKGKGDLSNRIVEKLFVYLTILFTLCVTIQVFLAGLATFVISLNWVRHISFVHYFEFIPVLMFIVAFAGKLPKWARWQSAVLFGIIFILYFTANSRVFLPWAAAAHPVIAMILFWLSISIMLKSFKLSRKATS